MDGPPIPSKTAAYRGFLSIKSEKSILGRKLWNKVFCVLHTDCTVQLQTEKSEVIADLRLSPHHAVTLLEKNPKRFNAFTIEGEELHFSTQAEKEAEVWAEELNKVFRTRLALADLARQEAQAAEAKEAEEAKEKQRKENEEQNAKPSEELSLAPPRKSGADGKRRVKRRVKKKKPEPVKNGTPMRRRLSRKKISSRSITNAQGEAMMRGEQKTDPKTLELEREVQELRDRNTAFEMMYTDMTTGTPGGPGADPDSWKQRQDEDDIRAAIASVHVDAEGEREALERKERAEQEAEEAKRKAEVAKAQAYKEALEAMKRAEEAKARAEKEVREARRAEQAALLAKRRAEAAKQKAEQEMKKDGSVSSNAEPSPAAVTSNSDPQGPPDSTETNKMFFFQTVLAMKLRIQAQNKANGLDITLPSVPNQQLYDEAMENHVPFYYYSQWLEKRLQSDETVPDLQAIANAVAAKIAEDEGEDSEPDLLPAERPTPFEDLIDREKEKYGVRNVRQQSLSPSSSENNMSTGDTGTPFGDLLQREKDKHSGPLLADGAGSTPFGDLLSREKQKYKKPRKKVGGRSASMRRLYQEDAASKQLALQLRTQVMDLGEASLIYDTSGRYARFKKSQNNAMFCTSIQSVADQNEATFELVPGLELADISVSLEAKHMEGHFMRHMGANEQLKVEATPDNANSNWRRSASWKIVPSPLALISSASAADPNLICLESVNLPSHYIRYHPHWRGLYLSKKEHSANFIEETTFRFGKPLA